MNDFIQVIGAREHNLKNISLKIPKNKLVVITGLSGSGKSTLAFDTLYAEGQRRYLESLSSYARQFLDRVGKPDVDKIDGLTPAIAIDQKTTSKNPRSTVGTITEVYDYLRLLYARVGTQFCYKCGKPISKMSAKDIIEEVNKFEDGTKITIYAPLIKEKKGGFADLIENYRNKGYIRVFIDGVQTRLDEEITLNKNQKHTIKLIIDRLTISKQDSSRLAGDIEKALNESFGEVEIQTQDLKIHHFSEHLACFDCKISYEPLEPLSFSFNSIKGACPNCDGLGVSFSLDLDKIIDSHKSIEDGAIKILFGFNRGYYSRFLLAFCKDNSIDIKKPYSELSQDDKRLLLYGSVKNVKFNLKKIEVDKPFEGVIKIAHTLLKNDSDFNDYMTEVTCSKCKGDRLKPESLAVKIANHSIADIVNLSIENCLQFFQNTQNFDYFSQQNKIIANPILKEIIERVNFLNDVGLNYLSLGRDARTISGGEAQRIRIASQIGSGLSGVMYVLDEPSIGLHEKDTNKLIKTLRNLQKKGNSVIVVEHDKKTIFEADYIIDIGPKAGKFGGEVVFAGTLKALLRSNSLTSKYLNGQITIDYQQNRIQDTFLKLKNININNIKNLDVKIPLKNLVAITGVSGSGKSSLIIQTLLPTLQIALNRAKKVGSVKGITIEGLENLDKVIYLDQSPIGRTPRSNPATYTGLMDEIRNIFAQTKEAKLRGYKIGRFSFNVKGGRCEKCSGEGEITIAMHFLPDINITCDACKGTRYNSQTLEIKYKDKSISDVLNLSVDEALEFFRAVPKIYTKLLTLSSVGLGYITLGQNATTLSGGEAQRIKISKELSKSATGKTLYILDEPTTGLHFADVDKLTKVLQNLVNLNNSVLIIEHNLDVIKNSDYIIDMGPDGGSKGGKIIAQGSVKELTKNYSKTSYTAQFLKEELES